MTVIRPSTETVAHYVPSTTWWGRLADRLRLRRRRTLTFRYDD